MVAVRKTMPLLTELDWFRIWFYKDSAPTECSAVNAVEPVIIGYGAHAGVRMWKYGLKLFKVSIV